MNTTIKAQRTIAKAQRLITHINANKTSKTKLYPKALDRHLLAARAFAEREGGRNNDGTWDNLNYGLAQIWENAHGALIDLDNYRTAVANPEHGRRRRVRITATENNTRISLERLTAALHSYNPTH